MHNLMSYDLYFKGIYYTFDKEIYTIENKEFYIKIRL